MDNPPAFPSEQGHIPDGTWNQTYEPGMSLRQWYAGKALEGYCANPKHSEVEDERIARWSWSAADAMLAEQEKEAESCQTKT